MNWPTDASPLTGLEVIEMARIPVGQRLSDLGAEVIEVESPQGDDTRRWGPPFIDKNGDVSAAYFLDRSWKASVAVYFRTEAGQARVRDLVRAADIPIENFKLGGLAKYGLDYENLRPIDPRPIYCSIAGFGQTGPYAHRAGYGFIVQGMSGPMSIAGEAEGQPQKSGVATTDLFTGVYAVTAILAALHRRRTTGRGQHIDMSLLDVAVAVSADRALNYPTTGTAPGRMGNTHPNLTPYEGFDCSDGHIVVATGNDARYQRPCRLLGLDDMAEGAAFATDKNRIANRRATIARLNGTTATRSLATLLAVCERDGVPAGPINTMDAAMTDPRAVARGMRIARDGIPGIRARSCVFGCRIGPPPFGAGIG